LPGTVTTFTKERLEVLEENQKDLEMEILQEELFAPYVPEDKIRFWLYKFRGGDLQDPEHRQRLIDSFINAIYLFDDHFVITFNYKEGCKTVSLGDIMGAVDKTTSGSDTGALGAPKLTIFLQAKTLDNAYCKAFRGLLLFYHAHKKAHKSYINI
jgi:site-specific DNA recombinase